MALSEEKIKEVITKLEEVIKRKTGKTDFKCPVCTNENFIVVDGFASNFLTDQLEKNIVIGGRILPSVLIICSNCGNTHFLNTKVLGLNDEQEKIKEGEKDQ